MDINGMEACGQQEKIISGQCGNSWEMKKIWGMSNRWHKPIESLLGGGHEFFPSLLPSLAS